MSDLNLVYYPADILNKELESVNIENPAFNPLELRDQMHHVMMSKNGIGLAASQVNLDQSLFVMKDAIGQTNICINPQVLQAIDQTSYEYEGCLSFPGIFVRVYRPTKIMVEYYDHNLEKITKTLDGKEARVFLHEYDHTKGVTFKDRSGPLKWRRAIEKRNKVMKKLTRRIKNGY